MKPTITGKLARIDERCDRFEADWRAGRRPNYVDYLTDAEPDVAQALRVELVLLEEDLRREFKELPTAYDALSQVFEGSTMSELLGPPSAPTARLAPPFVGPRIGAGASKDRSDAERADFVMNDWTDPHAPGIRTEYFDPTPAAAALETAAARPERSPRAAANHLLAPGRTLGSYEILETLAAGGMGIVYKARQIGLGRLVAVKTIKNGLFASEREHRLFQREIELLATLDHPNIVPVLEEGDQDGIRFFSMKLIDGESLRSRLAQYRDQPLEIARLTADLADAVHYAHQHGILHRDLKPSNVLIDAQGRPQLIDFGLAVRLDGESTQSISFAVSGTPCYMAPEQTTGRREETTVTDVYGLGTILYSLLTAQPPFQSSSAIEAIRQVVDQDPPDPSTVHPTVDRDLETICLKCLEKKPGRRYASAHELAEDLRRFLDGRPILARPVSRAERLTKWARRRPGIAGLLLAVALSTATGLGGIVYQWRQAVAARADLQAAMLAALTSAREARIGEELAHHHEYTALINLAARDWRDANVGHLRGVLEQVRPRPGQTDHRGFEWYYLAAVNHRERLALRGHKGIVRSVAYHPEGARIATSSDDRTVRIWEAATGRLVRTIVVPATSLNALAYSPDGKTLAVATGTGKVMLWDPETGQPTRTIPGHAGHILHLAFSPDGKTLASAGRDHAVGLADVAGGKAFTLLQGHAASVLNAAFSPDGKTLASASADGVVKLWNTAAGTIQQSISRGNGTVSALAFTPDSKRLAIGETAIQIRDTATGANSLVLAGHAGGVSALAFTRDGRWLVSTGHDQTIKVWDAATGRFLRSIKGHTGLIYDLDLSPDGTLVATAGDDRLVKIWRLDEDQDARPIQAHDRAVLDVALAPDGSWFATAGADRAIKIWDVASGASSRTLLGHTDSVRRLSLRRDGAMLASAGGNAVKLWNVADGTELRALVGHPALVFAVAFSPDGKALATGDADGDIRFWDPSDGARTRSFRAHLHAVKDLAFSPDGAILASAGADNVVRLWDVANGQEVRALAGHDSMVNAVAFSPDGKTLASGSHDRTIRLWDVATGAARGVLRGHVLAVEDLAFLPDGRRIASIGGDRNLRIWDPELQRELVSLEGHTRMGTGLAVDPGGRRLFTSSVDQRVLIWEAHDVPEPVADER